MPEAELVLNAEGVPYSEAFGDVYHSAHGGPAQARHVFLQGNDLPARWRGRDHYTVVETGFGLGLNFLETWRALEEDLQGPARLDFVSVENHPFSRRSLAAAHARWPEHQARSQTLLQAWPLPLAGFHRLELAGGRIVLTLLLGDAQTLLPQVEARADAFYLDGFAPERNPQLWSAEIFTQLARMAAPGASVATWSVAAGVRRGLAKAGCRVEKRPGFAAKREMLTGRFEGRQETAAATERRAIVIGAGLAGTACAHRLAARGWEVEVLERNEAAAMEGSGNPVGFIAPLVNVADALNAQLSRAAFDYSGRHFEALDQGSGEVILTRGVLRILRDAREAGRFERLLREQSFPPELVRYVDIAQASAIAGWPAGKPGLWFENGASIAPVAACLAHLRSPGIAVRYGTPVSSLRAAGSTWEVLDQDGGITARAPVVIIASALQSLGFAPRLRLEPVRGQISLLSPPQACGLKVAVTGDGHATLLRDGRLLLGATFQPLDLDPSIRVADHAANFERAEAMLPGLCAGARPEQAEGRVGFRTATPDRLPMFGPVRAQGLHAATGLGARGLMWAPLGAELLASNICGEPWPVPRFMAEAMSPTRYDDA